MRVEDGAYWVDDVALPYGSVIHLRGMLPYWNSQGRGVITAHGAELGLMSVVRQYASGVFQSGRPRRVPQVDAAVDDGDQAAQLKAAWLAQHGGAKRSIAVLNATTEFHPIQISPVDAQLAAAREWSLRDIALAFGVPAYMLGAPGDSSTYANVESRMVELAQFTLLPWVRRIESTLDAEFPSGTSLKVDMRAMMRADTKPRYEAYKLGIDAGWLTPADVRPLRISPLWISPPKESCDEHSSAHGAAPRRAVGAARRGVGRPVRRDDVPRVRSRRGTDPAGAFARSIQHRETRCRCCEPTTRRS